MATDLFVELSLILVIAAVISAIMKLLKQPLIIGYILTGVVVSPYLLNVIKSTEIITIFSQIGIAFLLFIVGLNLSPKIAKEVGKISIIIGLGQVFLTFILGYFISKIFSYSLINSMYISIALTFSSTIIVVKLLSDRQDLEKLYGKISLGILIVQDIIAVFILLFISSFSNRLNIAELAFGTIIKLVVLVSLLILASKYSLPKLSGSFAKSQEILFLFSIAWGLGLATLFHYFGLSIEIGALIAGMSLAATPYNFEISAKMRPLRDFFIILFFILLGSNLFFGKLSNLIFLAIIFSLFVLIVKPLIIMTLMGLLGYSKRNSFMTSVSLAQISEFSLIIIALGVNVGHLSNEISSLVTAIGLITIAGSTYFILYSEKIYFHISKYLTIFERKSVFKEKLKFKNYDIILFGYNRVGYGFLESFKQLKKKFIVIDYNPEVISELSKKRINCKYGDADDEDFLQGLNLDKVKMIVSTIPDFETSNLLIKKTRELNKKAIMLVVSHDIDEAKKLYEAGATYVIMPHFLGGSYASMMINKYGLNMNKFLKERKLHLTHLKMRKDIGHEHPKIERNK